MQKDDAAKKPDRLERVATVVPATIALTAAAVYFVGWQYKQSLALAFGFASYPGDMSFQGTVATGVTVYDVRLTPFLTLALLFILGIMFLLEGIPVFMKSLLRWLRTKKVRASKLLRTAQRNTNSEPAGARNLKRLRKQVSRWEWFARLVRQQITDPSLPYSVGAFVLMNIGAVALITLMYYGHLVARLDAADIRLQAGGACAGCFVYRAETSSIVGVPLFQSPDTIYVLQKKGLTQINVAQLKSIKPYGAVPKLPFHLPQGPLYLPRR